VHYQCAGVESLVRKEGASTAYASLPILNYVGASLVIVSSFSATSANAITGRRFRMLHGSRAGTGHESLRRPRLCPCELLPHRRFRIVLSRVEQGLSLRVSYHAWRFNSHGKLIGSFKI
jgi:hypothetical protein